MAGYLAVGFAFGILAVTRGFPLWSPILMSMIHLSGTGQFAIVNLYSSGSGFEETIFAATVLNLRYPLMSLALAQKLDPAMQTWKRMIVAAGDADEVVAVALGHGDIITVRYFAGVMISAAAGWNLGTFLGVFGSTMLPASVVSALGIALHAMFLAIIIPLARKARPMLLCVSAAAAMNIIFEFIPFTSGIGSGWRILFCGILSAVCAAVIFPKKTAEAVQ